MSRTRRLATVHVEAVGQQVVGSETHACESACVGEIEESITLHHTYSVSCATSFADSSHVGDPKDVGDP